ncbi:hypothetical protein LSAT2_028638 [Lamellibrachia satsuma]|nr:hypothetical protein LSAT2_028638 [Lamellibrachia satsuma]
MVLRVTLLVYLLLQPGCGQFSGNANSTNRSTQHNNSTSKTPQTSTGTAGTRDATTFDTKQGDVRRKDNTTLHERLQTAATAEPYKENNTVSVATDSNIVLNQSAESMNPCGSAWVVISQFTVSFIGYVANKITFITFVRNGDMFSPSICLLLKHQALVDSTICAIGIILLLQPLMWTTGNTYFDALVCHIWHSQGPFWYAILLSVWNLAAIAVERYIAVCRPLKYSQIQRKHLYYVIAGMYVAVLVTVIPTFFQVRFVDDICLSEYYIQGPIGEKLFYANGFIWFFAEYMLPVAAYVYLYGNVVVTLYRKKKLTGMNCSKAIDAAQSTLTKTAITLTVMFIFAIGYDAWAFLLGSTDVVEYKYGSAKQKVGVFFSIFNSVVNPFIYLALMRPYRLSLKKSFLCCLLKNVVTGNSMEHCEAQNTVLSNT